MNRDILQGKWKQLKGQAKVWWGKLSDNDLDRVGGRFDVLAGLIQQKYGISRRQAEEEIDKHLVEFQAKIKPDEQSPKSK